MNAPDTNLGVGAAEEIRTPPLPADAKTAGGCSGTVNAAALGAADWLCLAAAPTFAIMALLTGVLGGDMPDMPCSAAQHALPLSGMVPMYLLMSVFHAAPWLKLVSGLRSGARRSRSGARQIERRRAAEFGSSARALQ